MRKTILFYCLCLPIFYYSQVGIGTTNPQAVLHVDGAKDNATTGAPTAAQEANDLVVTATGNVGIGNASPQRSLDVDAKNQSLRVRNLIRQVPMSYDILTRDITTGDVVATSYSYTEAVTVAAGASATVTVPATVNIATGLFVVKSTNGCSRAMITSFVYNGLSLGYVSGVARDKIGNATIAPIPVSANSSGIWSVTFSNVTTCADGGTGTQFDFTVVKPTTDSYTITNNGNIAKTYQLTVTRL
ncbi:hypothetical protein CEY12_18850 [Chryseobacterium sp. T16E-39]|uniref:hypothetical protein n=1 Tax=Chryseobacterium sp. T16E-39 TaxID=2015076 RepID=UPI000B5B478D|nr:hypothetical protein [Chryseobacterium sp. T16E-39]ASK32032.1 hypothetical protein CEY12_18850 [Chryseobacterium sp. T16E-39]